MHSRPFIALFAAFVFSLSAASPMSAQAPAGGAGAPGGQAPSGAVPGAAGQAGQGGQGAGRAGGRGGAQRPPAAPAPRWPDGRVNFGPPRGETGVWERRNELLAINPNSYQAPATRSSRIHIDQIPLQPWARELTNFRHTSGLASEPYTRCKPAGGPRQFMSPYGLEIVDLPDLKQVMVFNISNAHTYRIIYMDGRPHPKNLTPSYFGHSVGKWEGDTLVIDSVGYSEEFWMNRDGLPHTSQLHLTERLTRTDMENLNYEVTVDDPGAYTGPWTSGYTLGWTKGNELFEYVCQENNLSPESMAGDSLISTFVP